MDSTNENGHCVPCNRERIPRSRVFISRYQPRILFSPLCSYILIPSLPCNYPAITLQSPCNLRSVCVSHYGDSSKTTPSGLSGQSVPPANYGHLRVDGTSRGLARGSESLRYDARRPNRTDTNTGTVSSTRSDYGSFDSPRRSASSDPISSSQGCCIHH